MNILGRPLATYPKTLRRLPSYLRYSFKCLWLFKRPLKVLYHYLTLKPMADKVLELRSGLKIFLSGDRYDVVTVFLIFVRQDDGQIPPGSTVIDIGANIGVFALYAAYCQAKRVLAYEPNTQAYGCLVRNVRENHLERIITAYPLAVASTADRTVKFPVQASPFNAILDSEALQGFEWVNTTTLQEIVKEQRLGHVELLKMDCEGAEYEIVFQTPDHVWQVIQAIRLEYHRAQVDRLTAFLAERRFQILRWRSDGEELGNLWLAKG